jgi:hypothetical protein
MIMPPKMLILRGNASGAGTFPDEQGKTIAWPFGALHVDAASNYARKRGYFPVVLGMQGYPQHEHSPQATEVYRLLKADKDDSIGAIYGFSGGGYNVRHILTYLAKHQPDDLQRFELVVVIGSPNPHRKDVYLPSVYNAIAKKHTKRVLQDADWEVVYRENPTRSQMPAGLPAGLGTHMFGPDLLLSGWPE